MDKTTIIKTLRDMAKYPTVTLPRDTDALKSAADLLEQAEQAQPVAWFRYETVYEYRNQLARCTKDCIGAFPVYTSPPLRQPDPVIDKSAAIRIATALGWTPPRQWVGLTDVEWMNIVNKDNAWFGQRPEDVAHEVAKLVEAKLKQKNGYTKENT